MTQNFIIVQQRPVKTENIVAQIIYNLSFREKNIIKEHISLSSWSSLLQKLDE